MPETRDLFEWALEAAKAPRQVYGHTRDPEAEPAAPYHSILPAVVVPPAGPVRLQKLEWIREYQDKFRRLTHAHFRKGEKRGYGIAATGAGKTAFFCAMAADVLPHKTLVLVDQENLVDQTVQKLRKFTGIYADVEQAERRASPDAKVIVATVQTIGGRLSKYHPQSFKFIICDECDKAVTSQWTDVLDYFNESCIFGVTATEQRLDRKPLSRVFGKKIWEIGMLELIEMGFLSQVEVQTFDATIDLRGADDDGKKDYTDKQVIAAVEGIYGNVCEAWKKYAPGERSLMFLPDVQTSKDFADEAVSRGIRCAQIDGTSKNKKDITAAFHEGYYDMLSNPILLSRGYDEPAVSCVCNLRPTKSISLYCQIIGRGTRLFCPRGCPGPCLHPERKTRLLVLDPMYQFKGMGPIRPASLLTDSPEKQQLMQQLMLENGGRMNLREALESATQKLRQSILDAMMTAAKKQKGKGEYFNALQWAANLKMPEVMDYVPETDAEAAPASKAQLKRLQGLGFVPDSIFCTGQAERILAHLNARHDAGLATMKQVFWLRKWGYRDPENMDRERASSIMAKEFAKAGKFGPYKKK